MASRNYQTYMGPTDPNLRHSEIEGYQPVSRIGEVVINSFSTPDTLEPVHALTPEPEPKPEPKPEPEPAQLTATSSLPCRR